MFINAMNNPGAIVNQSTLAQTIVLTQKVVSPSNIGSSRPDYGGIVQGVATINGSATPGATLLLTVESSGMPVGHAQASANGAYTFDRLTPGKYAVVVLDTAGNYRGKVIHTIVP